MSNPPQVPPPGVPLPQGPPSPPNRALWWVLGVIILLLVLIIGGGIFVATQVIQGISVKGPNQVELHTVAGNVNIEQTGQDNTGLPVYPGAARRPNGAQIDIEPSRQEGGFALSAATYLTPAAVNSVAGWYRKNLDQSFEEERGGTHVDIEHVHVGKADLAFISHEQDQMRIVALKREGDRTKITLVRMGQKEPQ